MSSPDVLLSRFRYRRISLKFTVFPPHGMGEMLPPHIDDPYGGVHDEQGEQERLLIPADMAECHTQRAGSKPVKDLRQRSLGGGDRIVDQKNGSDHQKPAHQLIGDRSQRRSIDTRRQQRHQRRSAQKSGRHRKADSFSNDQEYQTGQQN